MRLRLALLLVLAGCPSEPDDHSFRVVEPSSGASLDRCNFRVRTTPPVATSTFGGPGDGLDGREHINWRVDGGRETEAQVMWVNRPTDQARIVFGVTVPDGASTLEAGSCDEFDICDYKPIPVVVNNTSGAPDCSAMHGGQLLLDYRIAYGAPPLPDGRLIAQFSLGNNLIGLVMLKPDGSYDTTFGTMGVATVELFPDAVAQLSDGSYLVLGAGFYISHVTAAGMLDLAFGSAFGQQGVRVMPCPHGAGCVSRVMKSDGSGGVFIAASSDAGSLIMRLDASLNVLESVLVDSVQRGAVAMEANGRTLFANDGSVAVGTLAGLDTTFGAGGIATFPSSNTGGGAAPTNGAIAGSHVAVTRPLYQGNDRVVEVRTFEGATANAAVTIPLTSDPMNPAYSGGVAVAAIDAAGRTYVAAAREHSRITDSWYSTAAGSEVMVARIANGALDSSFGNQGTAGFDARDVWVPVATEDLADHPVAMTMTEAGPWVVSVSSGFGTYTDPNILRGPGVMLARIKP
jgi:hypothetical protein